MYLITASIPLFFYVHFGIKKVKIKKAHKRIADVHKLKKCALKTYCICTQLRGIYFLSDKKTNA